MVIELLNFDFPIDLVLRAMLNSDWKVTSIVEESEFTYWDLSSNDSSGLWLLRNWLVLWSVETDGLATKTITLLEDGSSRCSNGNLLLISWLNFGNSKVFLLHVIAWEVTEGRMLSSWQILVLIWFPLITRGHRKTLLKVILKDHLTCWSDTRGSIAWLHAGHVVTCSKIFLIII